MDRAENIMCFNQRIYVSKIKKKKKKEWKFSKVWIIKWSLGWSLLVRKKLSDPGRLFRELKTLIYPWILNRLKIAATGGTVCQRIAEPGHEHCEFSEKWYFKLILTIKYILNFWRGSFKALGTYNLFIQTEGGDHSNRKTHSGFIINLGYTKIHSLRIKHYM